MKATILCILLATLSCQQNDMEANNDPVQPGITMETYTNSIGMEFIQIPAGSFLMGAPDNDRGAYTTEKPQHPVTISEPFYIGKYEVTQAEWEAIMEIHPYDQPDMSNSFINLPGMMERIRRPNHPATVSWNDAQEFIRRLNEIEGHNKYRLPTEAEWEYACRAGTTTAYSFGDNINELGEYAWYNGDFTTRGTHPVGQKKPNPWGLFDMHGNVWEWTKDYYSEDYYAVSPDTDPQGLESGNNHSVRGGSWHTSATSWRSTFRKPYAPSYRGISIGFRVVLEE